MIFHYLFEGLLVFATITTSLVAGLLFSFTFIIMPGIARLDHRSFLLAFQTIDGVIQRGSPIFGFVWLGSIVSIITVAIMGLSQENGLSQGFLIAAAGLYLLGVQLPTVLGNIPLNNHLQAVDLSTQSDTALVEVRQSFERPWNRLNRLRTAVGLLVSLLLILARG